MRSILAIALFLFSGATYSQTGTLRGKVVEEATGEALIGCPVSNKEKTAYRFTDMDGNYTLRLPAGKHWIIVNYIGYQIDSAQVEIKSGEVTVKSFSLLDKDFGKGLTVYGKAITGGAADENSTKKNSSTVDEVLGSAGMQAKGANTAAEAAAKTTGVSVEGGKYVYVRGLSDRYSKTTLNGAEVPGLDPNRNSVQMDLFPTSLLDKLIVKKSFSPDLPASFTGGLVNIVTKDFPENYVVTASVKVGFNTQATLNKRFLGQSTNGGLDFLGFDDGSRGAPDEVERLSTKQLNDLYLSEDNKLNELGKSFKRDFDPVRKTGGFNQSYGFSIGDQIDPKNADKQFPKIGYVVGLSYRKNYSFYEDGNQGRYNLVGSVQTNTSLNAELNLNDERSSESVLLGGLGNFAVKLNEFNKIAVMGARFQNGVTSTRFLVGNNFSDANDLFFQTRTLMYQQRSLTTVQLKGEHSLGNKDEENPANNWNLWKMDWTGSYTLSQQETPELKFFTNDYTVQGTDTVYDIQPQLYSDPSQFYRYMEETNIDVKVNFEKPFRTLKDSSGRGEKGRFKFGGSYVSKSRLFNEQRYDFVQQSGINLSYNGSVADYMADANFNSPDFAGGYLYLQDATERRNSYRGEESIISGYGMVDIRPIKGLAILAGARVELDSIFAQSFSPTLQDSVGGFNKLDLLPSFNMSYDLKEDTMKIRFAYTRTLARPTFRELAPFSSFDFVGGNIFIGNRDLQRTAIDNLDLRWELYPSASENLSVGVFAKRFTDPIERAFNPEASNAELTWRNVDEARAYGFELDFRKKLIATPDSNSSFLKYITVGANITLLSEASGS